MNRIYQARTSRMMLVMMIVALVLSIMVTPAMAADTAYENYDAYVEDGTFQTSVLTEGVIGGLMSSAGSEGNSLWSKELQRGLLRQAEKYNVSGGEHQVGEYTLDDKGYKACQGYIVSAAKKADIKSTVDDMGMDFNVKADTATAGVALSGLEQVVSAIVGILCYAVTLGMTLFTAIDICYITMPVFRNKCEDMKQSGGGAMVKTNSQTGETQLRWITDEAMYAVQSCSIETGKNPLTTYIKKRVIAFVMLAIVLFILFTGNIQLIVNIAINFIAGIMDALGSLGA